MSAKGDTFLKICIIINIGTFSFLSYAYGNDNRDYKHMKIYIHIYRIRTEKRISLRHLADLSGVGKTTINEIENGNKFPTLDTLVKIAEALEVDAKILFDYRSDET